MLDTQLLLRGATARRSTLSRKIYLAWLAGRYDILLSEEIFAEFAAVFSDPFVVQRLKITDIILEHMLVSLQARCQWIEVTEKIRACRDPSDDKFLECAVYGRADLIVSADKDLLDMAAFQGIAIIDAPTFWRRLAEQSESNLNS